MIITFEHNGVLPVDKYGGTERVLYWLMKGLVEAGQQVNLISLPASHLVKNIGVQLIVRQSDDWSKQIPTNTDLVHTFCPPPPGLSYPHLTTIHGNGYPGEHFAPNTVFVSKKHAANHHATTFVYNGIDLSEYPFNGPNTKSKNRWQNFLFLAKARWKIKNLRSCVHTCRQQKKYLEVAGGHWWGLSRYVRSHGMIDQGRKNQLLESCDALLFPVIWEEPFGLAVIEAMAKGRPVIGSPYGGLPELITTKVGIIAANEQELMDIVGQEQAPPFDPAEIRNYVEKNFSHTKMVENYLQLYAKVCRGETLNASAPVSTFLVRADSQLLPF